LHPFAARFDVEFDGLSLFQVAEALALDGGIVYKNVVAFLWGYEAIAFVSIEPLDGSSYSFRHVLPFENVVRRKVQPAVAQKKSTQTCKSLGAHLL
jgi:uncharacterized NAD(P)/FAD-binding protein YdhS